LTECDPEMTILLPHVS